MPAQTWEDQQLAMLRGNYPNWDIWFVPVLYGPDAWCAKRKGEPIATINAHSPEELVRAIREQG